MLQSTRVLEPQGSADAACQADSGSLTWMMAPAMTRNLSMAGPRVAAAVEGSRVYSTTPAKKGMPAHSIKRGVAPATPLHPSRSNRMGDTNMRVPVTRPVHMATSPMKACSTSRSAHAHNTPPSPLTCSARGVQCTSVSRGYAGLNCCARRTGVQWSWKAHTKRRCQEKRHLAHSSTVQHHTCYTHSQHHHDSVVSITVSNSKTQCQAYV